MLFYDLPLDIKDLVLSYNFGDVRLLKIKNINVIKNYNNKFKPVYKSRKLNNKQHFEIDNINTNNGTSYIFKINYIKNINH